MIVANADKYPFFTTRPTCYCNKATATTRTKTELMNVCGRTAQARGITLTADNSIPVIPQARALCRDNASYSLLVGMRRLARVERVSHTCVAQRLAVSEKVDGSDNPRKVRSQLWFCQLIISDGTSPQDTSPLPTFTFLVPSQAGSGVAVPCSFRRDAVWLGDDKMVEVSGH